MMKRNDGGESGSFIRTFLRIRPSKQSSGFIKVDEHSNTRLGFHVPVETRDGEYINNTRTTHHFKFDGVLRDTATQEEVFAKIGKNAVINVLDGYNSTVFAYGQTGSGKTFTVTGGAERYVDRGIIPRALSLIFAEFKERNDQQFTCHISYLEIYNEQGFDLLDPGHDSKKMEDIPKVSLMEDEDGNIHLRNLSVYLAANEEEALNYLFLGDTNRAISETAMNKASSRSHCIFTISVEGRKHGSEKVMRSKLHLVDLAGSERVHKTQTGGQTLVEAKHINVSLFFLEMVIVALRERGTKGRQHIPYRNSMMTSVLRDSLGGNCKTVMIATVNPEAAQTEESMSTCRFAQRVSTIKNDARVNENVDPEVMIRRLRSDCAVLADEVAFLKGEAGEGEELTSVETEDLKNKCRVFVEDTAPTAQLAIGTYTLTKLKRCFVELKAMVLDSRQALGDRRGIEGGTSLSLRQHPAVNGGLETGEATPNAEGRDNLGEQLLSLRDALRQRDNEIAILVNMLKQGKCHSCVAKTTSTSTTTKVSTPSDREGGWVRGLNGSEHQRFPDPDHNLTPPQRASPRRTEPGGKILDFPRGNSSSSVREKDQEMAAPKGTVGRRKPVVAPAGAISSTVAVPNDIAVLGDLQKAFAHYRERHPGGTALEENKKLLGEKYARAKVGRDNANAVAGDRLITRHSTCENAMGERVNQAHGTIQYLKNTIEQVRRERALDGLVNNEGGGEDEGIYYGQRDEEGEEEAKCKAAIEVEKEVYMGSFQELRELKSEIEHIQRLLEKGRKKLQAEFQAWYEPLVDAADEPAANNFRTGGTSSAVAPAPGRSASSDTDVQVGHPMDSRDGRNWVSARPCEQPDYKTPSDGSQGGGLQSTLAEKPRLPVAAWGTPSEAINRNKSLRPVAFSKGDEAVPVGGAGSSDCSSGGGLRSSRTGIKKTDEDIAAFYRAKEELELRRRAGKLHGK